MGGIDILRRLWRRPAQAPTATTAPRPSPSDTPVPERSEAKPNEAGREDDLTAIKGIGAATQQRLHVAGIKSYSQLAHATPKEVGRALAGSRPGARVEQWIRRADELAQRQ